MPGRQPADMMMFLVFFTAIVMLLIIFMLLTIYRSRQKLLAYFAMLRETTAAHKREIAEARVQMEEHTYHNISREIHDNIGQKLTLARLRLRAVDPAQDYIPGFMVADAAEIVGTVIEDLRNFSRSINSDAALDYGLAAAISNEIEKLRKCKSLRAEFYTSGEPFYLPDECDLSLLRIVQECLTNIIRHACASRLSVALVYATDILQLKISDNGVGLHPDPVRPGGLGLRNVRKRIELMRGSFKISSIPGQGTTINLQIPYTHATATISEKRDAG